MPRRISAIEHEYAGARLKQGDAFECEENDLRFMLASGRIVPEKGEAGYVEERLEQTYDTRDMVAKRRVGRPRTRAA